MVVNRLLEGDHVSPIRVDQSRPSRRIVFSDFPSPSPLLGAFASTTIRDVARECGFSAKTDVVGFVLSSSSPLLKYHRVLRANVSVVVPKARNSGSIRRVSTAASFSKVRRATSSQKRSSLLAMTLCENAAKP